MRTTMISGLLAVGVIAAVGNAPAQAGSDYPVCLRVYGPANYNECSYTSIAQCNASASGRAAECYPNAFAAYPAPARRWYRRHSAY